MTEPLADSDRQRVATMHQIPTEYQDLLTETDPTRLEAQATMLGDLVRAGIPQTPAFQSNPGQGMGTSGDDGEWAEYHLYHPKKETRR